MNDDPAEVKGFSLRRWSQRKHAAARDAVPPSPVVPVVPAPPRAPDADARAASVVATPDASPAAPGRSTSASSASDVDATRDEAALPSLESLTIDSDFTGFMRPGVDADLKRGALKKLFSDARFNVMDGLDVYIDDYSKPDPIDPAIVRTMVQARYIFNPPATRVNAAGHVEDVPADEATAAADGADSQDAPAASGTGEPAAALPSADVCAPNGDVVAFDAVPASASTPVDDKPA